MKQQIIAVMLVCLFGMNTFAQKTGYTILGEIKDLPDGVVFYLIQNKDDGAPDTIDRVKSKSQKFMFKGTLKEEGVIHFIKIDTSVVKRPAKDAQGKLINTWVRLLLENSVSQIKLFGNLKDWPKIDVQGSSLTKQYDEFIENMKTVREETNRQIENAINDKDNVVEARKEYNVKFLKHLESISGSYAVPLFLLRSGVLELEQKDAAYKKLSSKLQNSYYGKQLKQQILSLKKSKEIGIGKVIPDFQIKTPQGEVESIKALAIKSKFTLLDFWAWWCAPCRADMPNLKKVYGAFHDKGFNILSISTDPNDAQWKKALKEENTPWTNGMQEGNPSNDIFGISGIPAYILLNEKAEIVAMDLTSKFSALNSLGTINGASVLLYDKKKSLRGDDLYEVMRGLLGEGKK